MKKLILSLLLIFNFLQINSMDLDPIKFGLSSALGIGASVALTNYVTGVPFRKYADDFFGYQKPNEPSLHTADEMLNNPAGNKSALSVMGLMVVQAILFKKFCFDKLVNKLY